MIDTLSSAIEKFSIAIVKLSLWLTYAFIVLIQFLVILVLGILVAIIYALPWALRIGAIVIWFYGGYRFVIAVGDVYTPFSPEIPVMILQFFVVFVQLGTFILLLLVSGGGELVWGILYFTGGVPLWLALKGIPYALESWMHADFIFSVLPPALWVMMLIYLTLKGKARKAGKTFSPPMKMPDFLNSAAERVGTKPTAPHPLVRMPNIIDFDSFAFDGKEIQK